MNIMYRHMALWIVLGAFLLAGPTGGLEAGEPQEKIRQTINHFFDVLADESLKAPERTKERREKLRQVVLQYFGFTEMARRSLGLHWRKLTPEQQQEFVPLFSDLLERSYVSKIESYGGNKENVLYTKEKVDTDGYASVYTEIVSKRDLNLEVEYRLLKRDGDWEVYDLVIEGVSQVNNYRTQFNKIIRQDSYQDLVKQMKLKLEQEEAATDASN